MLRIAFWKVKRHLRTVSFHLQGWIHSEISAVALTDESLFWFCFQSWKYPACPRGQRSLIPAPPSLTGHRAEHAVLRCSLNLKWSCFQPSNSHPSNPSLRLQNPDRGLQGYIILTLLHMKMWNKYHRKAFLWRERHKNGGDIYSLLNLLFCRRSCKFLLSVHETFPKRCSSSLHLWGLCQLLSLLYP